MLVEAAVLVFVTGVAGAKIIATQLARAFMELTLGCGLRNSLKE